VWNSSDALPSRSKVLDNAPEVSWDFFIGGYQPAQKWLKDRKGHALSFEEVKHYQRISQNPF
jgi:hypothetical protein